ncbi:hypothetical protein PXNS11_350045 [Stutzerimonas xanthomarina]|nr:hypothetical protein PXNS11_350045 [Stutzerimonas xanthomarina]
MPTMGLFWGISGALNPSRAGLMLGLLSIKMNKTTLRYAPFERRVSHASQAPDRRFGLYQADRTSQLPHRR